jgi:F-type H+-transporting ATPase subunit a
MRSFLPLLKAAQEGEFDIGEMILHHLADSHELEIGSWVIPLPQFDPVHIGPLTLDFSITKHVVFLILAALLVMLMLIPAARHAQRARAAGSEHGPKGAANVVEALVLFVRDEIAMKGIGHGGERYAPYIVGVFFFILMGNLLGLVPWGASPTGNISVTAALAVLTFLVVETAGMRELGPVGYSKTIFFAPSGLPLIGKVLMLAIMSPVEALGKLTKPFALAIRLYANMTAGHAVVLAFTGMAVAAGLALNMIWVAPIAMAVGIMLLEILVAFLQAYIFAMLSAVFIGLIRHPH